MSPGHRVVFVLSALVLTACASPSAPVGDDDREDIPWASESGEDSGSGDTSDPGILECGIEQSCDTIDTDVHLPGSDEWRCLWAGLSFPAPQDMMFIVGRDLTGASPHRPTLVVGFDTRSVSMQESGYVNGTGAYTEAAVHCPLRDDNFFDACLAEGDSDCYDIDEWLDAGCTEEVTCPE